MSPRRSRPSGTALPYTGPAGLRLLARQLGEMDGVLRKHVQRELRPALRRAGDTVKRAAAANASWSSRIPKALRTTVSFGKKAGVHVTVLESIAPHARPYEGLTDRRAIFRHPVFGDEDRWVSQATRPFLFPALQSAGPQVIADVEEAIDTAARAAGFR